MSRAPLAERLAAVELLILDVDGVLTDGSIIYGNDRWELKAFHVRDGSGIRLWQRAGKRVALISGRDSETVARRAGELDIQPIYQGQSDKRVAFRHLLDETGLRPEQCAAIGDDIPDLPVLMSCAIALAVADACIEVKQVADYVTTPVGGRGAVRDAIEWMLRSQDRWEEVIAPFRIAD